MPGILDGKYKIIKTIGSGASCKVKLAENIKTGKEVAVKIINDNMDKKLKELINIEVQAMAKINHINVINQIEYGTGKYVKDNGVSKEVSYIVLEIAKGGELFDFVAISGRFEEPLARYFFL